MERVETRPASPDLGRVNPALANHPDGRHPDSHPMRRSRIRPVTDPVLRGAEELAMVTGRVEVLNHLK